MQSSVRAKPVAVQSVQLRRVLSEFLPSPGLRLMGQDGRERWTPRLLGLCALLMPLLGGGSLSERFAVARNAVAEMYPTRRRPGRCYQGFVKALARESQEIVAMLGRHLRRLMPQRFGHLWHYQGRVLFGVDGTRVECPRTRANARRLKCAGRKKTGPQLMLTTLFHVGSGLPWAFRRGIGKASERTHLREMLEVLPRGALLLADAGFTGYDLLRQMQQREIDFIVRVGRNVCLLKKLGYALREHAGLVYLWPEKLRRAGQPPLVLRLVRVRVGRQEVCLLVSELDPRVLSDAQVLALYRKRWLLEVFYRSLKRTLGRHKLESKAPEEAGRELDWSVLALWVLSLVSLRQRLRAPGAAVAGSVAGVVRVIRQAVGVQRRSRIAMRRFLQLLRRAVQDRYQRHGPKAIRKWPRKKYEPPPGTPQLRMASPTEIRVAQGLKARCLAA